MSGNGWVFFKNSDKIQCLGVSRTSAAAKIDNGELLQEEKHPARIENDMMWDEKQPAEIENGKMRAEKQRQPAGT